MEISKKRMEECRLGLFSFVVCITAKVSGPRMKELREIRRARNRPYDMKGWVQIMGKISMQQFIMLDGAIQAPG